MTPTPSACEACDKTIRTYIGNGEVMPRAIGEKVRYERLGGPTNYRIHNVWEACCFDRCARGFEIYAIKRYKP